MDELEKKILEKKYAEIDARLAEQQRKSDADMLEKLQKYKTESARIIKTHKPENAFKIMRQLVDDIPALVALREAAQGHELTTAQKNRLCFAVVQLDGFDFRLAHREGESVVLNKEIFR